MKNMIKKLIAAVMVIVTLVTMNTTAFAEDIPVTHTAEEGEFNLSDWDYEFYNDDKYIILNRYNGIDTDLTIKGKITEGGKDYDVLLAVTYDYDLFDYHSVFENNTDIETVTFESVDGTAVGCSNGIVADNLFKGCTSLRSVDFNYSLVGTGDNRLLSIDGMFEGCESLEKADLTELDLSECTSAEKAFKDCKGITEICLDGVDFSNLHNASQMFYGCTSLYEADLTTAVWGETAKDTYEMFADDYELSEVTIPEDLKLSYSCKYMFRVDYMKKLTVKGRPSEEFKEIAFSDLYESNRYLGKICLEAGVELEGEELTNDKFSFTLYEGGISDENVVAIANNDAEGRIDFGVVEIFNIMEPIRYVAAVNGNEHFQYECDALEKEIWFDLNEDGTLSIRE